MAESDGQADAHTLLEMLHAGWMGQAICAAAELALPDRLEGGARSAEELARETGAHAPSLERLLRALAALGLCAQDADGRYRVTPTGALLRSNGRGTLRAWALWWGRQLWPVWGELAWSVRTGTGARARVTGAAGFEALERDPALAALFNRAMAELTAASVRGLASRLALAGRSRIVDVGGGHGELLAAVLEAWPDARGVLFDRPHAEPGARSHLAQCGLAARCEFVAGDFFESVPGGADAYLLKSVLDDWDDERALVLLGNCRRAMRRDAVLMVIEPLMPERMTPSAEHRALARADLMLLVTHGAGERTEPQMRGLLARAGFTVQRVAPAPGGYRIVEAQPAP